MPVTNCTVGLETRFVVFVLPCIYSFLFSLHAFSSVSFCKRYMGYD